MLKMIMGPALRRVGTFVSGWLLSVGVSADQTTLIVNGILAAGFVAVDIVLSNKHEKAK